MEKVDIAQEQNGNGRHSAAARKKKSKWSIMVCGSHSGTAWKNSHSAAAWKKVVIVEHHRKGRHSAAAWKKKK